MDLKNDLIKAEGLPRHIAIIMDGNGRWAKQQGLDRFHGHKRGVDTVKEILEACGEIGLDYLTLYTFSIENWNRPKEEVDMLMALMVDAIVREEDNLLKQNVKVEVIGNIQSLPEAVRNSLNGLLQNTSKNTGVKLVLALSYGARWEIAHAARQIAQEFKDGSIKDIADINEDRFSTYLTTAGIPDPDLLIRTGGESRLSNFLLWQSAYTEFYFIDKFWPDFKKEDLYLAIRNFMNRERRFGMTGEQVRKEVEK
ncbi:isoprenyl transferase [Odoribacter sp. OttesenSCG-928-J03]|nr:isoprenyl transferase [Odoribacter sp. OttesenSCG-928-J03]MDL2283388.1 isoprenyl transferase [Odoribacter sp. OttesenSCG-928-G04]